MSGGTHDYFFFKINTFIESLEEYAVSEYAPPYINNNDIRNAFIEHLKELSEVARIVEWVDSGDKSEGKEIEPIIKLLKLDKK